MNLNPLIEISRRYGADSSYVLLGGGNTSVKEDGILYVKASGHALGGIDEGGFVRMDLSKLDRIWHKTYSDDDEAREDEVLADMMACRLPGETSRPSVEALLHALLPFPYVVHLHPALVNGITCAQKGEEAMKRLFSDALWVELVKPGFTLASVVRTRMGDRSYPMIFLENHGIFVGSDSIEGIEGIYDHVMTTIEGALVRKPDFRAVAYDALAVDSITTALEGAIGQKVLFETNVEVRSFVANAESFGPVASSFTPDHIVYAGFKPLWVGVGDDLMGSYHAFEKEHGSAAKIIAVEGLGVFSVGEKPLPLFLDTVAIAVYSESFGGPKFMTGEMIEFIRNWEVERYRAQVTNA
ncbi:MAG TPA: class II aldolase/adducin family protein [Sphaerochaeta sp.]|jgi:rhamnose utilization protein RhaD (predicted bifunctional aldolase and dehydrogenase)|nr:class II aldolase/adducin family protein [Spirochaetota bacterium]NLV61727.1 class II aldolase [Spirochaetales bacterium]HOE84223.1 class II aldolase/adducin family protein [Sphaerochaeta sp.]HOQ94183.1 class II aldolase/adducin family protein [Sphaerochaeta sp.]HPK46200.1 class II aldolase/adducin family protein [Sphaerochaeta sp.]